MMIADALKMIKTKSAKKGIKLSDRETQIVLSEALGSDITYIIGNKKYTLTNQQESYLNSIVHEMIDFSKPIEKITGKAYFYGLELFVNGQVLSPRQDTEILVDQVIKYASSNFSDKVRILDIGTGSGCLSIAAAVNIKDCTITATDISDEALDIAKLNIDKYMLGDRIKLKISDLFSRISDENYDIIMTNPPYISDEDHEKLDAKVKDHDPEIALRGGNDGLVIIKRILSEVHEYLCLEGVLFMEIGYDQANSVKELMKERFKDIRIYKDYGGNDRVIYGKLRDIGENI